MPDKPLLTPPGRGLRFGLYNMHASLRSLPSYGCLFSLEPYPTALFTHHTGPTKMHKYGVVLLLALVVVTGAFAFVLPSATPQTSSRRSSTQMRAGREQDSSMERRGLLQDSMGKMLGLSALVLGGANLMGAPQQAEAAVGEGTCREWKGRTWQRGVRAWGTGLHEWRDAHKNIL
jgi:hypothetical protein